jgi:hypothetical protein
MSDSEDRISKNQKDEKGQKDLLWGLYLDMRNHARHAETLRVSAVSYMLAVASALIAVITFDHKVDRYDLPLSILVALIGLITALFSASYAELYFRNRERANNILKRLDELFFYDEVHTPPPSKTTLSKLIDVDDRTYNFSWARIASTHWVWVVLPSMVLILGSYLIYECVKWTADWVD